MIYLVKGEEKKEISLKEEKGRMEGVRVLTLLYKFYYSMLCIF
jgi:hypothetical protein